MVQVKINSAGKRETMVVSVDTSIETCLEQAGVTVSSSTVFLNGAQVSKLDLDRSLADHGVADGSENNTILATVKADSAC